MIDVAHDTVIEKIPCGYDPEQVAVSPDGKTAFVSNEDSAKASAIDLSTKQIIWSVPVGREPEGVLVTPDGTRLYVTAETDNNVSVLDVKTGKVIKVFTVGARPRFVAFDKKGAYAYVTAEAGACGPCAKLAPETGIPGTTRSKLTMGPAVPELFVTT